MGNRVFFNLHSTFFFLFQIVLKHDSLMFQDDI